MCMCVLVFNDFSSNFPLFPFRFTHLFFVLIPHIHPSLEHKITIYCVFFDDGAQLYPHTDFIAKYVLYNLKVLRVLENECSIPAASIAHATIGSGLSVDLYSFRYYIYITLLCFCIIH